MIEQPITTKEYAEELLKDNIFISFILAYSNDQSKNIKMIYVEKPDELSDLFNYNKIDDDMKIMVFGFRNGEKNRVTTGNISFGDFYNLYFGKLKAPKNWRLNKIYYNNG
jgi:hypothetical protein